MDKYNLVSGAVSAEFVEEIHATVQQWKAKLPGMVPLSKETRSSLVFPGAKGLNASRSMALAAQQHAALFPVAVADPAEVVRDADLAASLLPVRDSLVGLLQVVEDLIAAGGSDAYRGALKLYGIAQVVKSNAPGLEGQMAPLIEHLDRPSRKPAEA